MEKEKINTDRILDVENKKYRSIAYNYLNDSTAVNYSRKSISVNTGEKSWSCSCGDFSISATLGINLGQ